MRGTLFHSHHGDGRRETAEKGKGASAGERLTESLDRRAVWVFALWRQSHDSLLYPAWLRIQPSAPPLLLSTPRCPHSLQPHPLQAAACFPSTVPLPWSCG
ncbi:hypothetical protein CgunFtcFv8_005094 [Champsocephalus gunnari]|uniref:Uncharacterized protein n=1 Tax=Champsocephalus gunnari TaxID=52237 RepID=A0AAN8CXB8_CHAGU|nr:hypothetical protein CgunFtcFv8_005094 [Champsocephalus gunnari]